MTLVEVVSGFLRREPGWGNRTLHSDGKQLMSYDVVIARWKGDAILMPDSRVYYSRTTSRHRSMLRIMATDLGIPLTEQ